MTRKGSWYLQPYFTQDNWLEGEYQLYLPQIGTPNKYVEHLYQLYIAPLIRSSRVYYSIRLCDIHLNRGTRKGGKKQIIKRNMKDSLRHL